MGNFQFKSSLNFQNDRRTVESSTFVLPLIPALSFSFSLQDKQQTVKSEEHTYSRNDTPLSSVSEASSSSFDIWEYFEKGPDVSKVKCKLCGQVRVRIISGLKYHVATKHKVKVDLDIYPPQESTNKPSSHKVLKSLFFFSSFISGKAVFGSEEVYLPYSARQYICRQFIPQACSQSFISVGFRAAILFKLFITALNRM